MKEGFIVEDWLQLFLAESICIEVHERLICVLSGFAVQMLIATDDRPWTQLNMEVLVILIVLEADAVLTCCYVKVPRVPVYHVNLLINRIILLENVLFCLVKPWF